MRFSLVLTGLCAVSLSAAASAQGARQIDVDVARVSRREPGMNPVELMTSESQERMLAIVEPANLDAVLALARRWEVRATVVARVDAAFQPEIVAARAHGHDDLFEGAVAGAFAQAVDGAFDLARAFLQCGQRVRYGEA